MTSLPPSPPVAAGVYGVPPLALASPQAAAIQLSPLKPGAARFEDFEDGAFAELTVLAPPGVVERRYCIAQVLRVCAIGAEVSVMAPKDRGGSRLRAELEGFGCSVVEMAKRHHRICTLRRPAIVPELERALEEGGLRLAPGLQLWSQPGVFSWDRVDPGSALLLSLLPAFNGTGADLGAGVGVLALAALTSPALTRLTLIDHDRRAIDAARRNVTDARTDFIWADVREPDVVPAGLDFVIMNPPFHDGGQEERGLGLRFIAAAAAALRKGGTCWLVANRHLPYEAPLAQAFAAVAVRADTGGYKVFEARK